MIEHIVILSLITFAIWWTFQEGEIFGIVQVWFANLDPRIQKPLYDCAVCMHFYYGSLFYWLIYGSTFAASWKDWLITVIAGIGLNGIIVKLWPPDNVVYHEGDPAE